MSMTSRCCGASMISPVEDEDEIDIPSMWRAYTCYICKYCRKACQPAPQASTNYPSFNFQLQTSVMNKVILHGRIGRNPEIKVLEGGQCVTTWSMATSRKYKDKSGNLQEDTQWHNCQCWGPRGETIAKHFAKGDMILVEGELRTRDWEKDGVKHYRTEVSVLDFNFSVKAKGGPSSSDAPPPTGGQYSGSSSSPAVEAHMAEEQAHGGGNDDLPF